jgi:hypothetical protein
MCGHSFCRRCVEKNQFRVCRVCRAKFLDGDSELRLSVLLSDLVGRLFPRQLRGVELRRKAKAARQKGRLDEAVVMFGDALGESE